MLIRSQDKNALVDISGTTIRALIPHNNKPKIIAYGNNQSTDMEETLGVYDTEERAIEVLDKIQHYYTSPDAQIGDGGFDIVLNKVFEMPEE